MGLGATPKNQLDALPLRTAQAAANPDQADTVGNKVWRYWSPTTTGILGVNMALDPDDASQIALFSNFLDFSGMNEYVALLIYHLQAGASTTSTNVILRIQYRTPGGTVMPKGGAVGATMFANVGNRTPGLTLATPNDYVVMWGWTNPQGGVTTGPDARLWFGTPAPVIANRTFDLHVWASQS